MPCMSGSAAFIMPGAADWMEIFATSRLDDLPETIFPPAAADFFSSRLWYETVIDAALPDGVAPCFVAAKRHGVVRAVFPLRLDPAGPASLTTPYTCRYAPLFAADADQEERVAAAASFGRFCRRYPVVRLDALASGTPDLMGLAAGARAAGLIVRQFRHFGNWHEALAGRDVAAYLAGRPGSLRETIRRKLRRAEARTEMSIFATEDGLEAGIAAFEQVYARSWKEPEPFPRFNAALMRAAAARGLLRLFVLKDASGPIAVQFWIVAGGIATVLKLAHDEAARDLSPGTILTAHAIRTLIAGDGVTALDFGRGDDPYKSLWASARRQRVGLLLINPRRPAGLVTLARHMAGEMRRSLRGTLSLSGRPRRRAPHSRD